MPIRRYTFSTPFNKQPGDVFKVNGTRYEQWRGYVSTWLDGEQMRQIRCDSVQWTWTQYDRELASARNFRKRIAASYGG